MTYIKGLLYAELNIEDGCCFLLYSISDICLRHLGYNYVKEASGVNNQTIKFHPLNSTSWTETGVTWNNVGSINISVNFGITLTAASWSSFNITNLVKGWKNGTYSANAGFILKNATSSSNLSCVYPKWHDKINLKNKWGN